MKMLWTLRTKVAAWKKKRIIIDKTRRTLGIEREPR